MNDDAPQFPSDQAAGPRPRPDRAAAPAATPAELLQLTLRAIDASQDLVAIVDRAGRFLHVSEALCRWTGRTPAELATARVWEGIFALDAAAFGEQWNEAAQRGGVMLETEVLTRDGHRVPVEMSASHVSLRGREALCTISRDRRPRLAAEQEKMRLQEQLSETQRLEGLGVLAGGIAHDFNNLLTAILGNASLARDSLERPETAKEMLRNIEGAANQAAGLCRQMLAYAGHTHPVPEPLDLSAAVADAGKLLEIAGDSARLEFRLAPDLPPVTADSAQVRQLLLNLVHNAAEAIDGTEGWIVISTARVQVDRALAASARVRTDIPDGEGVTLAVTDNGAGIDAENLQRIFEPFFTTKFAGRGLGLPAVLGIVRSHRALLHVDSTPGRGSSFRVTFSAAPAPRRAVRAAATAPAATAAGARRVLVVDDEPAVRQVATEVLGRLGFTTETVPDAEAALAAVAGAPQRFALLLVDMTMPGMDGPATVRELRRRGVAAPAILMSGFSELQVRGRIAPDQVVEFLQKPFDVDALRAKVEALLPPAD